MKCFYHKSDLDGHCSGAIIKLRFPECEMIGVDYKDSFDDFKADVGETIYVVDFRFPADEMKTISEDYDLHWIDHHKTSIDEAHASGFLSSGGQSLEVGIAACELTWGYLFKEISPLSIRLLSKYDIWDHEDQRVMPFQWGMRDNPDTLPDNTDFWKTVFFKQGFVEYTTEKGAVLLRFQANQDAKYAKGMSYETEFEGFRAIVMNKSYANSKAFDAVYDPEKHDIMIMFGVKPGQCKYAIYCDKPEIDVSEIAKKYGGGGHRGAAGFFSETVIV